MVKVDEYARIRQAHRIDKLSIRQLARQFHHSRRKIREVLGLPEPKPYRRRPMPSVLDSFKPIVDEILRTDEDAPRKQRHTAAKIFRRLRDEHQFAGGYDRVRRYVLSREQSYRETFIPLDHDPGQRIEADFGHIHVDFPDGRRLVPVLLTTWSYSNCPFVIALPTERTEAILHGIVEAFAFFGCVPRELWWDNPKTVAPHIFVGRQRQLNERYQALSSHYTFEPLFCMVRRPQEKPHVVTWQSLKANYSLVPLFSIVVVGMAMAAGHAFRSLAFSPDVKVNRRNPERPWESKVNPDGSFQHAKYVKIHDYRKLKKNEYEPELDE